MVDDMLKTETSSRPKTIQCLIFLILNNDASICINQVVFIDEAVSHLPYLVLNKLVDSVDGLQVQVEIELG